MTRVLYVAEAGSMHKGDVSLCCEMVRQAKQAGADIFKLQFGWPEADKLRHVSDEFATRVDGFCKGVGIELLASIWSEDGLRQAQMLQMKRLKVAYQKKDDGALLSKILSARRPVFVSGGDWSEMTTPIWCVSKYPTYPDELKMPDRFNRWYGYSDHSHGIGACLLAVARGAMYIEKHFCIDKTDLATRDTPFSADASEFAQLVQAGREIERFRDALPI